MSLEENVKKWVSIDNDIRQLNNKIKILKNNKNIYNEEILLWISNKNLNNPLIKINDGRLKIVDTQYQQPLTFKLLYECLLDYFDNDTNETIHIINFIKSKRTTKTNKEIKRFINKENLSELSV